MSTQEIGELIESVNDLTQTVAGKMGEIDQKVDEATASVPTTIKNMSVGYYHVDCHNGDDSNDGLSSVKAFRNISAILGKLMPGGQYMVYLSAGEHYVDNLPLVGNVRFQSRTDANQYRVSTAISQGLPIDLSIYTKVTVKKSANKKAQIGSSDTVNFYNCLVSHDLNEGQYAGGGGQVGYVGASVVQAPSVQFSISGYESDDYDVPLVSISGYGGNTMSSVGWEILAVKGKINKVIGGNSSAKGILAMANNTFINKALKNDATTPSDLYVEADFRGVVGS